MPPEVWAAGEQDPLLLLLLLEPEEFLQGVLQLTQVGARWEAGFPAWMCCSGSPAERQRGWRGRAVGWGPSLISNRDVMG